jgi:hypothetical protein
MSDWVLYGNPIPSLLVADLTEEQRARLRQVLDGMLRERTGTNGRAVLTNAATSVSGRSEAREVVRLSRRLRLAQAVCGGSPPLDRPVGLVRDPATWTVF